MVSVWNLVGSISTAVAAAVGLAMLIRSLVQHKNTPSSGGPSSGADSSGGQSSGCSRSYNTVANDSCTSIAQKFGISVDQFRSLNPSVSPDCSNLHIGTSYCVGFSGADSSGADPSGDESSGCSESYTAVTGDSCVSIAQNFGISADEFLSLNPSVSPECTNLHVGTTYCV